MKNLVAILVFAFAPLFSFSQNYVITIQGDTLKGTVRILSIDPIDQVRVEIDGKKKTFTALKVREILFGGETYQSMRNGKTQKFMKVIKSGYLSLYGFKLPNQTRYDGLLLAKKNGQSMEVPNLGFKKLMMSFLEECQTVVDALDEETLKRQDLNVIIDKFNGCSELVKKGDGIQLLSTAGMKEKIDAVDTFKKKVDALEAFSVKKDVLDIVHDIQEKLEKQEPIPSYLYGVLKTHLANQATITDDLDKLIALLTK